MATPLNLFDYEALAEAKLPAAVWDFIATGACDGLTLAANRCAFERWTLRPRVLVDVDRIDTRTTVLGQPIAGPLLIAPMGWQGIIHPDADFDFAIAAQRAGLGVVASAHASRTLAEMAAAGPGAPLWLQLYLYPERDQTLGLLRRAEDAGCRALVLTVDAARWGRKERSLRTEAEVVWPEAANLVGLAQPSSRSRVPGAPATWADVDWLMSATKLPIVLKGVLAPEDAALAAQKGVAGIIVSNHGGRQLDSAIASLDALPDIVEAAGQACEIYVDGGVRRGTDIVKALALGARAVLVGRPILWGVAAAGADGAFNVLRLLTTELEHAMALCGCPTLADLDRSLLR